jgi:signal transduction histidine kinase
MKKQWSLSLRLATYLMIAQLVALVLSPFVFLPLAIAGFVPGISMPLNVLEEPYAKELVVQSLRRSPNGTIRLDPAPTLRAYIQENPAFRFAAFDSHTGAALPGSSPELATGLSSVGPIRISAMTFHIVGDLDEKALGEMQTSSSPAGEVFVAVYHYSINLRGLLYWACRILTNSYLSASNLMFTIPQILGIMAVAWFIVQRGLAPLRVAADKVSHIDLDSLNQRIPDSGIPKEVTPFVYAVNEALTRLDAGVAAQRRFLSNAAHELLTPIAILRARIDSPGEASFKEDLKHDVRRIQMIVEQLLVSARISNRENTMDAEIDLGETISELVADYIPLVVEKGHDIEFEAPPCRVMVRGNRRALESAVVNLIDNALRAEPVGGTILVRVQPGATIEVIDHGEGIAPSDRDMIFEPFWRKDDKTPGTGLGLSIVKELVAAHCGAISLEPTPGGGATFRIVLQDVSTTYQRRAEASLLQTKSYKSSPPVAG